MEFYLPELVFSTLDEIKFEQSMTKEELSKIVNDFRFSDSIVETGVLSIFETSALMIKKSLDSLEKENESEIIYKKKALSLLNEETTTQVFLPYYGDLNKPFLVIMNKDNLSDENFDYLQGLRITDNFILMDANELGYHLVH